MLALPHLTPPPHTHTHACVARICTAGLTSITRWLEVVGTNLAATCSGCLPPSALPAACTPVPCSPSATLCGSGVKPVVTVRSLATGEAPWSCDVLCVAPSSATVTTVTCATQFLGTNGTVEVSVGGASSAAFLFDDTRTVPELDVGSATPPTCPSDGCTVTLTGRRLGAVAVLVTNALGTVVQPAVDAYNVCVCTHT
jgi:hypothetical protein